MRIKYVSYLLLIFTSLQAIAQHDQDPISKTPIIVPPPPNSASLGLYGQVPLNQFTGNGIISIPLHTIKSGNLELPISLSYSSDGIKVDQYESNVGMGWALNAGGVVTRQVFDYQDNYNKRYQKPNTAYNSSEMKTFLDQASSAPEVDTQPDIFSYNFGGLSGKFFLDDNNLPVEIEPTGIKIEITSNFLAIGTGNIVGPEITITDTKGIKYFFGGIGAVETSQTRDLTKSGPRTGAIKTSWYLTKIVDPMTNNEIILNYNSNAVDYVSGLEQTLDFTVTEIHPVISLTTTKYNSSSSESILKEIISSDSKITFTYSKRFTDNDFAFLKVDEINCYDKQDVLINKIGLNYTEYIGDSFSNYKYLPNEIKESPNYLKKRFYLTKISEHSNLINSKVHQFDYYSPEKLPARFSFAKDHYGVFNGKDNSTLITDEIEAPIAVAHPINSTYTELANRKPDSNFGYFGLLKTITYPTKGTTTLVYEPHVRGKVTIPIYPNKNTLSRRVKTVDRERSNSDTTTIFSSDKQTIKLNSMVASNSECEYPDPHDPKSTVSILDRETNTLVTFYDHVDIGYPIEIGPFLDIAENVINTTTFTLEANKSYDVTLSLLSAPCVVTAIDFDYYSDPITYQEVDVQVGGFRVLKTIKDNGSNGLVEIEKYFYGYGSYISKGPVAYMRRIERNNPCEYPSNSVRYSVSSSDLGRIYSCQNAQFGYSSVTKSYGENFENGGEQFIYELIQDGLPYVIQGEDDKTTPLTNGFGSGRLLNHKVFKIGSLNKIITLKETINEYKHDIAKDKTVLGHVAYVSNELFAKIDSRDTGPFCPRVDLVSSWSLNEYSVRSQWSYLNKSTEKYFDKNGENAVTVETNYDYNNSLHCQPTLISSKSSTGKLLETKYAYPHDLLITGQSTEMQKLVNQNRIDKPIKTETFVSNVKTSESITKYEESADTGNLLLPKYIFSNKGNAAIDTNVDRKITYDKYDNKGNILQYTVENGTPVSIIWGYNQTQPIAKIENATYAQAIAAYSTNDVTFRSNLPNAMVTTYTYIPLVGVKTITDPKGLITTYDYDGFNRLKVVKDEQGYILTENQYHYRN
jgi:hypothetical protein